MRDTFGTAYMREEFSRITAAIDHEVTAYLIGGGAMAFRDLKDTTKDVDLVVRDQDAFQQLVAALEERGYETVEEPDGEYAELGATTILENDAGCRFDLFYRQVVDKLVLSKGMADRSDVLVTDGNLTIRMASPEDIFLFKSVAGRATDIDDMNTLVQTGLNFDQVLDELRRQIDLLDDDLFVTYINEALIDLRETHGVTTDLLEPVEALAHEVYDDLEEQKRP